MSMPRTLDPGRQSFQFLQKQLSFHTTTLYIPGRSRGALCHDHPLFFLCSSLLLYRLMLLTRIPSGRAVLISTAALAVKIHNRDPPLLFILLGICSLLYFSLFPLFCYFNLIFIGKYITHKEDGENVYIQLRNNKIKTHKPIMQVKKQNIANILEAPYIPLKCILLLPPGNNH